MTGHKALAAQVMQEARRPGASVDTRGLCLSPRSGLPMGGAGPRSTVKPAAQGKTCGPHTIPRVLTMWGPRTAMLQMDHAIQG